MPDYLETVIELNEYTRLLAGQAPQDKQDNMEENSGEVVEYPKAIGFIIGNEFCERFSFYGMRTILVLYLTIKLGYNNDTATVLFHVFISLVYVFPLLGAIIADSWLGRFRTILYLSIVYCLGSIIISFGAIPPLKLSPSYATILGLILIAIGTGGIKPCVSAFGGDQFEIPQQTKQLATFFSLFYFAINAGALLSTSITPILREDVHCFSENHCFSLAFGMPGLLMILAVAIFIAGKHLYVMKEPSGNMVVLVFRCVVEALKKRSHEKNTAPQEHWLDYAIDKYGHKLVNDTKSLFRILILYLPLPIFWALNDQQGSRWTFQATRMTGHVGSFAIKPDQMQVVNPLLVLVFIPFFEFALYPVLELIQIKRPLQKLIMGGFLASVAFVLSGFVELSLEAKFPTVPGPYIGQLRIYNPLPCAYFFKTEIPTHTNFTLNGMSVFIEEKYNIQSIGQFEYYAMSQDSTNCPILRGTLKIQPNVAMGYLIQNGGVSKAFMYEFEDAPQKPHNIYPYVRIFASLQSPMKLLMKGEISDQKLNTNDTKIVEMPEGSYTLFLETVELETIKFTIGGVYVLLISRNGTNKYNFKNYILTQPNSVHILWQVPQYAVMAAGEVMFSVTGLEFSFTQAPLSMKSVLQACWLLTVAVGNLIVIPFAKFNLFKYQSAESFIFAILMVVDLIIFIFLAINYEYVVPANSDVDSLVGKINEGYSDD